MGKPSSTRDQVASVAVRTVNRLSRLSGRGSGTVVGGRVGMKIAPDLVATLASGRTVILVSGTNGKTTTTSMIVAGWGGPVTTNETGANMPAGHVAALVESIERARRARSRRGVAGRHAWPRRARKSSSS